MTRPLVSAGSVRQEDQGVERSGVVRRTIAERLVGDIRLTVLAPGERTEEEFGDHVREARRLDPLVRGVLVVVPQDAGGLSPGERRSLVRAGLMAKPTAVMTDSMAARGIMTALRWMGASSLAAFALRDLAGACEYLGTGKEKQRMLSSEITSMKTALQVARLQVRESPPGARPPGIQ